MKASKQVKMWAIAVLAILAVIIVIQNIPAAKVRLLFATVEMPLAILLIITLGLGFSAGMITAGVWFARK